MSDKTEGKGKGRGGKRLHGSEMKVMGDELPGPLKGYSGKYEITGVEGAAVGSRNASAAPGARTHAIELCPNQISVPPGGWKAVQSNSSVRAGAGAPVESARFHQMVLSPTQISSPPSAPSGFFDHGTDPYRSSLSRMRC
jgi:hypothetical protein